jgi:hypothetical protein
VTIRIEIDGNEVTLYGTTKGDSVDEKARQYSAWKWSPRARAFVLPRNLLPGTRERNIRSLVASYKAAGVEVEVEDTGTVLSVAEEREQSEQRLTERAERYENRSERRAPRPRDGGSHEHALLDPIPFGQPVLNGRTHSVLKRAEQHRQVADTMQGRVRGGRTAGRAGRGHPAGAARHSAGHAAAADRAVRDGDQRPQPAARRQERRERLRQARRGRVPRAAAGSARRRGAGGAGPRHRRTRPARHRAGRQGLGEGGLPEG